MQDLKHVQLELFDKEPHCPVHGETPSDYDNICEWYQNETHKTAVYPTENDLAEEYLVLGLVSEAGEVAGKRKKMIRDDEVAGYGQALKAEVGDVLWYVSELCNLRGWRIEDLMVENIAKLTSRKERDTLKGNGDER